MQMIGSASLAPRAHALERDWAQAASLWAPLGEAGWPASSSHRLARDAEEEREGERESAGELRGAKKRKRS